MTAEEIDIDYDFIKHWLLRGEIKKLAKEEGLTPDHGYKILNKQVRNIRFVERCYRRAIERAKTFVQFEEQRKALNEKINSL